MLPNLNNVTLNSTVLNPPYGSWAHSCVALLNNSATFDWAQGLVDVHGNPTSLGINTWGVDLKTCYDVCGSIEYSSNFDFQNFAGSMTNYFLPWVALTAQLPFETKNPLSNGMSFCLAVGSPALIMYSLTITVLNRFWVREYFRDLQRTARATHMNTKRPWIAGRINNVVYLLQEAQQVPLRASQQKGWLSSLLVIPSNTLWWDRVHKSLEATRRGVTASLVSQISLAAVAYLFTVVSSFQAELGDPATALEVASGSLWIWLIPVILGWITVGTQIGGNTIGNALTSEVAEFASPRKILPDGRLVGPREQEGLIVLDDKKHSGLSPQMAESHSLLAEDVTFEPAGTAHKANDEAFTWCGAAVAGDEQEKGPIYNYARLFTWCQLVTNMYRALEEVVNHAKVDCVDDNFRRDTREATRRHSDLDALTSLLAHQQVPGNTAGTRYPANHLQPRAPSSTGSMHSHSDVSQGGSGSQASISSADPSSQAGRNTSPQLATVPQGSYLIAKGDFVGCMWDTARYCDLHARPILAYPYWTTAHTRPKRDPSSGSDVEMQSLDEAAAINSVGDSSDAISREVYRRIIGASCAALFLQWGTTGASILIAYKTPTIGLGCRSGSYLLYGALATAAWLLLLCSMLLSHAVMLRYQKLHLATRGTKFDKQSRGAVHTLLCAAAVLTRALGKTFAVVNTGWLIVSTLLEYVGAYDNCWCEGNQLGLGSKGWVLLFKGTDALKEQASGVWGGGLAMTLIVCVIIFALIFVGRKE